MDFEERIDKLRERHEALALGVELLQYGIREQHRNLLTQGENIDRLVVTTDRLVATTDRLAIESAAQQQTLGSVLGAMKELIELVTRHERRIGNLEENG